MWMRVCGAEKSRFDFGNTSKMHPPPSVSSAVRPQRASRSYLAWSNVCKHVLLRITQSTPVQIALF